MNRKKILITFLAQCCLYCAFSQEAYKLSGKVIDAETYEPLAFATISIQGKSFGVVSNHLGEYEFHIPSEHQNGTLHISMLGYKTFQKPIQEVIKQPHLTIPLTQSIILLDEVEISAKQLTAKEIIKRVIKNIPINYSTEPYQLSYFARTTKKECGKYRALYEATFDLEGKGYSQSRSKRFEKIYLKETRMSQEVDDFKSTVLAGEQNHIAVLPWQNDLLSKNHSLSLSKNKYRIERYTELNGQAMYILLGERIQGKTIKHTYRMYVHSENFALLRIEWERIFLGTPSGSNTIPLRNSDKITKILQYEKLGNKYHNKYVNLSIQGVLFKENDNETPCNWEIQTEMMVEEIQDTQPTEHKKEDLLTGEPLRDQLNVYDSLFWNNYTLLKNFPISKEAIQDLESSGISLEQQFLTSF